MSLGNDLDVSDVACDVPEWRRLIDERDAALAEVARLREALQEIANGGGLVPGTEGSVACDLCRVWGRRETYKHAADCPVRIAQEELK